MSTGMSSLLHGNPNCSILRNNGATSFVGFSALPFMQLRAGAFMRGLLAGRLIPQSLYRKEKFCFPRKGLGSMMSKKVTFTTRSSSEDGSSDQGKTPFGYNRKDVLLIGLGVTLLGIGLESGLEYAGVDPLQAGNVVQLVLVLGLTVGWISTYIFRVSNKEMTYAQQLRDYENKVMEKRLEGLSEAELEALLEQVEEEKRRQASGEKIN
ncbi:hypothetical protein POPTR_015G036500v4 [Populus trichocarpa]|uniref:Uncharacterized protein n=1 Tax=Populus trichocarpa TaxID=3694 RepID=A0ACC0RVN7_POPTR|nr:uncharacterized protein LOC18105563 isoform X1 [Populus trichocarpa]XP_052303357.1 uncharacterized protein LOC18105563 isoform X1 [Populus trichocarpa]KAI5562102.1 hypothetical protein BDE02_15G032600 [Populus trichocarpa]KAI9380977.1 hypothetical protein POPTR_015G036500v4 [Populus trichocarpa]